MQPQHLDKPLAVWFNRLGIRLWRGVISIPECTSFFSRRCNLLVEEAFICINELSANVPLACERFCSRERLAAFYLRKDGPERCLILGGQPNGCGQQGGEHCENLHPAISPDIAVIGKREAGRERGNALPILPWQKIPSIEGSREFPIVTGLPFGVNAF